MSLRTQAARDTKRIVTNTAHNSTVIQVTNPGGVSLPLVGTSNDIGQTIDADTGQALSGRLASVAIPISSFVDGGLGMPEGIADASEKPWVVEFDDTEGNLYTFKIVETAPDRSADLVLCFLEKYTQ